MLERPNAIKATEAAWLAVKETPSATQASLTASVQRPGAGLRMIEEISKRNSIFFGEQHHRHAAENAGQAGLLNDDAPAVVRLTNGQISGWANDLHGSVNKARQEEFHAGHHLVANSADATPSPHSEEVVGRGQE